MCEDRWRAGRFGGGLHGLPSLWRMLRVGLGPEQPGRARTHSSTASRAGLSARLGLPKAEVTQYRREAFPPELCCLLTEAVPANFESSYKRLGDPELPDPGLWSGGIRGRESLCPPSRDTPTGPLFLPLYGKATSVLLAPALQMSPSDSPLTHLQSGASGASPGPWLGLRVDHGMTAPLPLSYGPFERDSDGEVKYRLSS